MNITTEQQHSVHYDFEGITIHASSQFMENSERLNLYTPTGKQLPVKHSDGSFLLISEMLDEKTQKKELCVLWESQGTKGTTVQQKLDENFTFDNLIDMQVAYDAEGNITLYSIVEIGDKKILKWKTLQKTATEEILVQNNIDDAFAIPPNFAYWSVNTNEKGEQVVLLASKTEKPFFLNIATRKSITLDQIELASETVQKVTLFKIKYNNTYKMGSIVLTHFEDDDNVISSKIYISIYEGESSIRNKVVYDDQLQLTKIKDVISKEVDGDYHCFLVTENEDPRENTLHYLDLSYGTDAIENKSKFTIETNKALELGGAIKKLSLGNINYDQNNLTDIHHATLPHIFIEADYDGENHLLKCDPLMSNSPTWQIATFIPDVESATIHYNPKERDVSIFSVRNKRVSLPQAGFTENITNVIEHISIDKDTSLFEKRHLSLQAAPTTEEIVTHTTCNYFYFEPDDTTTASLFRDNNANEAPYIELSATSKCSVIIEGEYYNLRPDAYQKIPLKGGNSLTILHKEDSVDSPVLLFSFPYRNTDKVVRYKTNYLADQKLGNISEQSGTGISKENLKQIQAANTLKGKFDNDAVFTVINKEDSSAQKIAAFFQQNNLIAAPQEDFYFAVDFSGETPVFFNSENEFGNFLQNQNLEFGWPKIFKDIAKNVSKIAGDIIHTIDKAIDSIKNVVIQFSNNVYTIGVNIAGKLIKAVVNTFEAAWNFMAKLAKCIWKAIKDVVKFLGYLFNFKDILATKETLKTMVNQSLDVGIHFFDKESILRKHTKEFLKNVVNILDTLKLDDVATGDAKEEKSTHNGQLQVNTEVAYVKDQMHRNNNEQTISESLFTEEFLLEFNSATLKLPTALQSGFSDVIEKLKNVTSFDAIIKVFKKVVNIFIEMVQDVVEALKNVIDTIFDLFLELLKKIKEILNQDITSIPFMGPILKKIVGTEFSFLDIFALATAIPVTVVTKIIALFKANNTSNEIPLQIKSRYDYNQDNPYVAGMKGIYTIYEENPREFMLAFNYIKGIYSEYKFIKGMADPIAVGKSPTGIFFGTLGIGASIYSLIKGYASKIDYKVDAAYVSMASSLTGFLDAWRGDRSPFSAPTNLDQLWALTGLSAIILPVYFKFTASKDEHSSYKTMRIFNIIDNSVAYPYRSGINAKKPITPPEIPLYASISAIFRLIEFGGKTYSYIKIK